MIKLENVSFRYKEDKYVLKNINLEVDKGKCVAIVGKNGSGKSTLAKLISGIIKPSKGQILVDEINTRSKKEYIDLRKKIGIVFQNPENQIIFNNIKDELSFALTNLNLDDKELRIEQSLKKVKLNISEDVEIDELSLGQKQRIEIASVLAVNPEYIVFDEPTTMIDSDGKDAVYNIISELKRSGYTIIYITNNTEEILLADTIIILDNGEIATQIDKKELPKKIDILKKFNIRIPIVISTLDKLKNNGIDINLEEYTMEELTNKIIDNINHNERVN